MSELALTQKEKKWLERFKKTMNAAPKGLDDKIWAYTTGDDGITLYDREKLRRFLDNNPKYTSHLDDTDQCQLVLLSGSEIDIVPFPFPVESTAG